MDKDISQKNDTALCGKNGIPTALEYIRRHCGQDLTLSDAAQAVYLSPTYFSRLFVQTTGMRFSDYLRQCRLERAKTMLEDASLTIYEIALSAGFRSSAYFIKLFSAAYGLTPGEYRKQHFIR